MLRASLLALCLVAPFAATAAEAPSAFPAEQYTAKVVMRRGGTPIVTAYVSPDVSGRFTVSESARRSYASLARSQGDAVVETKMSELRTGTAVSFNAVRDGGDLVLMVDAASRTLDSLQSFRIGDARIELPSLSACHGAKAITAHREGDGWRATLAMPECGIDTEITVSPART